MKKINNTVSGKDLLDPENFKNNEEFIITRPLEGTPFTLVGMLKENAEGRNWFGALGQIKMTNDYATEKEVIEVLKPVTWNGIVALVVGMHQLENKIYADNKSFNTLNKK